MLKLIITAIIVYFLYKTFFKNDQIGSAEREKISNREKGKSSERGTEDGEYIDYEEVD